MAETVKVTGGELVGEPIDLSAGVAEDDSLCDGDSFVQIGEGVQLPVLLSQQQCRIA